MGIVGFVTALANFGSRRLAPASAANLVPVNGLLGFVWWIMISVDLFGRAKEEK